MKYKVYIQPDEMSCGVTCLAIICAYYGVKNVSISVIRNFAQTDRDGNTIYSLKKAAEKLNMDTKAFSCNKEALLSDKVNYPMIVHTLVDGMYNHYMVLFEVDEDGVVLGDPANGQVEMNWEDFEQIWTKRILLLQPTENFHETKKYKRNYKYLINLILQFKKQLIIMAVFTGIISGTSAITTQFYSNLIDNIVPENSIQMLVKAILGVCGIFLLTVQLNLMKQKFSIRFNKQMDRELIVKIYNRITNLPMSFFSSRTSGDISARYQDGDQLRSVITGFSLDFISVFGYSIWALALLLSYNWQICVLALVMQELMMLIQAIYKKKLESQMKEVIKTSVDVDSFVMESFSASETVKSYNAEKAMEAGMQQRFAKYQEKKYKNEMSTEIQSNLLSTIQSVGNVFMLGVLGLYVMAGEMTVGELVKSYMYVSYIFQPINYISALKSQFYYTSATLERLDDVFRTTTEEELDKKKKNLPTRINDMEFENVSFKYGMRNNVLNDISFKVEKGDSIGIIGTSGCGKTTLIKLILGFYPVTGGVLKVNGEDINSYTSSSIRRKIAYVSQNDYWFQDTIFNNLTIGNQEATVEDLDRICKIVKMDQFIEKTPYGYNTMLEEGATNLSSGERQRFSIAKALITDPDVLVLDESTSNLDARTEEFIVEELRKEEEKIKIIIAHRLNTLRHCNKIIAIDNGYVVEAGSPTELIKQKGMFYKFWTSQSSAFKEGAEDGDENNSEE